jgi:SAM-dependent methyltransferase
MSQLLRLYERSKYLRAIAQKLGLRGAGYADISSERFIAYPWAFINLDEKTGRILDVGSTGSYFPLALVCLGYEVYTFDVRPYEYSFLLPNLKNITGDIRHTEFPNDFFKTVTAISTIEHIGLGRYGDPIDSRGDKEAINEIKRILMRGGELLLTVPYGRPAVTQLHRVYDAVQLQSILKDFKIKSENYFLKKTSYWIRVSKEDLTHVDSKKDTKGIACIKASK